MFKLSSSPKKYSHDLDKSCPPEETVKRVKSVLQKSGTSILAETRQIDSGRLDIPVFLSVCGSDAKKIMPVRKQMGKGASPAQAEASALMELVERYSFFSFWERVDGSEMDWETARTKWGEEKLVSAEKIAEWCAGPDEDKECAAKALQLLEWKFCPAMDVARKKQIVLPLEWFKMLNEFNGASAGNTMEETALQGSCELIERHVCTLADRSDAELSTIDPDSATDPVLKELLQKFKENSIKVILKDLSLNMPMPTVAALAYDPATFPELSEIVYTAGTSSCPQKAAIRALTEVAQLAGDFNSASNYEASGLPKYSDLSQIIRLEKGKTVPFASLPDMSGSDLGNELSALAENLHSKGHSLFCVDMTHPDLEIPACYNIVPGFLFRERPAHAGVGMFVGKKITEELPPDYAAALLEKLGELYPDAFFMPFYQGRIFLELGESSRAARMFEKAIPIQPDAENQGLCSFYQAHALTQEDMWPEAMQALDYAISKDEQVKEYFNLRGVGHYQRKDYGLAAEDFKKALDLDKGSATDLANLGACYKNMGQKEMAREFLTQALELDPNMDFARNHLEDL